MVSGFDRYFQLARCFRDEDLRNDRQPEFTQIDLPISFVEMEDVLGFVEAVLVALWDEAGHRIARPFSRILWRDAMERYGTDKPDLRYDVPIADWTAHAQRLHVPFFESALQDGARVRGLAVQGGGTLTRKDVDALAEMAKPVFAHHPFTAPHPDDLQRLEAEPFECRALHYDAVYNGTELGSGSIQITDPALQRTVLARLGISPEDAEARFGFLLTGLQAGAPPHGGFAIGFDRVGMLLAGAASLRDVIAFPKTTAARALFEGAPAPADAADLASLHLEVKA